jgi:drug/metabolite transporter (DMT)-like permease
LSRPRRSAILLAYATVYLVWGSTYLAIRLAVETLPPFLMAGARFTLAGAVLFLWARLRGSPAPKPVEWRSGALLGVLFLGVGNGGVVWAEQLVPSGLAALMVAAVPLWTAILAWLQPNGTRPSRSVVVGLALGLSGVALLAAPGNIAGGSGVDPRGATVLLVSGFAWAVASVLSGRMTLPKSASLTSAIEMLSGGALLLILGLASGELSRLHLAQASGASIFAFFYLIVFGSLVGFSAFAWLLRVEPPTRVATYAYVNPAVAVLLGWAILGEPLTIRALLAAGVIVGGVVLINRRRQPA